MERPCSRVGWEAKRGSPEDRAADRAAGRGAAARDGAMWDLGGWRALGERTGSSELDRSQGSHTGGGVYREIRSRGAPLGAQTGCSPETREWKGTGCKIRVNPAWVQLRDRDWESSCPRCS